MLPVVNGLVLLDWLLATEEAIIHQRAWAGVLLGHASDHLACLAGLRTLSKRGLCSGGPRAGRLCCRCELWPFSYVDNGSQAHRKDEHLIVLSGLPAVVFPSEFLPHVEQSGTMLSGQKLGGRGYTPDAPSKGAEIPRNCRVSQLGPSLAKSMTRPGQAGTRSIK